MEVLNYRKQFNPVGILGTGTMGAQLAAQLANCGVDCLLFGLTAEEDPQATAQAALNRLAKMTPPPLVLPEQSQYIQAADYSKDLQLLSRCPLVIEAISESLDIKQQLYQRVMPHLSEDAILASNTSALSINSLSQQLKHPDRFCGIHFFNPPRFLPLVELIGHKHSNEKTLHLLEGFLTTVLGKEVVRAEDKPGFIANRLGMFSMAAVFHWMEKFNLAPDTVDELTGTLIGRAKSACFRTADLVGLDILESVMNTLAEQLSHDPWQEHFRLPSWLKSLKEQGFLGQKTGKGIYHKTKEGILVFDKQQGDYRPIAKSKSKEIKNIFADQKDFASSLAALADSSDHQAQFLWSVQRDIFHYSAVHLADIAKDVRAIDRAMQSGFGWQEGVFELWQKSGSELVYQLITRDIKEGKTTADISLPDWASKDFYRGDNAWSPQERKYIAPSSHPVYRRQLLKKISPTTSIPFNIIYEDDNLRIIDIKDNIAVLSFKTKMSTLSYELLRSLDKQLDTIEKEFSALIIWQPKPPFCAGANLYQILAAARLGKITQDSLISDIKQKAFETLNPRMPKLGDLPPIQDIIMDLQNLFMRLKHGPIPTVAAVQGLALGGGCELLLHCDRVVAEMNSYIGLVEMGVGIIPAGGGCKEMARRAAEVPGPLFTRLAQFFEQIALAKVSTSAQQASQMSYLRASDKIIANPNELLYIAKNEAFSLIEANYHPPPRRKNIPVVGRAGKANFLAQLINMREGNFISSHDHLCALTLANILCGDELDENEQVDDEWFLRLEREAFIKLLKTKLSQDRMEHMLKKGKPLRN